MYPCSGINLVPFACRMAVPYIQDEQFISQTHYTGGVALTMVSTISMSVNQDIDNRCIVLHKLLL